MKARNLTCVASAMLAGVALASQTEVLFFFDTEDFTNPRSDDGAKEIADLMNEMGLTGHFAVVGRVAEALEKRGRWDVIDAMKPHLFAGHTWDHSVHPNLCERTDIADYAAAFADVDSRERKTMSLIRSVFGAQKVYGAVPPGNSDSYVAMYAYSAMGIEFYCGPWFFGDDPEDIWLCNMRMLPYNAPFEWLMEPDCSNDPNDPYSDRPEGCRTVDGVLDHVAKWKRAVFYLHPNKIHSLEFADVLNYKGYNRHPDEKWEMSPERRPEDVAVYMGRVREILRRLKADPRFKITTLAELAATTKPRVDITCENLPAIRSSLLKKFAPIHSPASWSVADVFQATVKALRGEKVHSPGRVYGFLEKPRGVSKKTRVSAAGLRTAASEIDFSTFLPPVISVDGQEIGPADFLFAALEVLVAGASEVVLEPRQQMPGYELLPRLENICLRNTWMHSPDLKDKYLSDRMRLQLWTMRKEGVDSKNRVCGTCEPCLGH